jgi:hypothetical protein
MGLNEFHDDRLDRALQVGLRVHFGFDCFDFSTMEDVTIPNCPWRRARYGNQPIHSCSDLVGGTKVGPTGVRPRVWAVWIGGRAVARSGRTSLPPAAATFRNGHGAR